MSTIDTHASSAPASPGVLACVADWIGTTDHKRIGRLYLGASALAFIAVAAVGVLLGIERVSPTREWLEVGSLTQLFALERFGFTYLVLLPAMLGVAIAAVPLQLGARALALPRLALGGWWLWLIGAVLGVYALAQDGGPGGADARFVDMFMLALLLVAAGLAAGACSVATSVLTTRAPGMNMRRVPYFSWAALVTSLAVVVALPVFAGDLLYLYVAHRYPSGGGMSGNLALSEWAGYGFTQPFTLLFALPVLGFFADAAATASGARLRPRGTIQLAIGLAGVGVLASALQAPPMLDAGLIHEDFSTIVRQLLPFAIVHGLPLLGTFALLALTTRQLLAAKPKVQAPVVYGLLAAALLLGAHAASLVTHVGDAALVGTTFEEGTWLLVVLAAVLAALGAVTYWGPKWWGRSLPSVPTLGIALVAAAGAALAAAPLHVAGFADQLGAVFPFVQPGTQASVVNFDYSGPLELWNGLHTIGLGLFAVAVLAFVALSLRAFLLGKSAEDDPWGGQTLEWATTSPAPADNFATVHVVKSAEPLVDLQPNRSDA